MKLSDIVLIEFNVRRWNLAGDANGSKREWDSWNVGFAVETVSLLFPGSEHYKVASVHREEVSF